MPLSTTTRYSAYSLLGSIFLFICLCWLVLWLLTPKEQVIVQETVITKTPVAKLPPVDRWRDHKEVAFVNNLEPKLVIAVAKSERLIKRPEEFEGACYLATDLNNCTQTLSKTYKSLIDFLGRKPTPSEVVLAHILGVNEALRISRLAGSAPAKDIGEKLVKENPNIASFETVRDFRIWLNRVVRQGTY